MSYCRPSENSTRTSEPEISLLGFATSPTKNSASEFGEDLCFRLDIFGINIHDILV